jgi:DNA processing protein
MPEDAPPPAPVARDAQPATFGQRLDWLRLARSRRVGPATFIRLLGEFGGAEAALAALPGIAAAAGASGYRPHRRDEAEAEWEAAGAAGAFPLFLGGPGYPPLLAQLPDPPPFLWGLGDAAVAAAEPIALVGARNASALGTRMATRLARELGSAGHAVASGLARGIDAAAHAAALPTGTVAVVAGGVDVVYPPENAALAAAIAERGLVLSEMPMGAPPKASHFLRRNRLVSGLSVAVVVVEAAERSGALNTARNALDQGREVLAVPGHPLDPRAGGCNLLIREGATLVRSAEDALEALAGQAAARPRSRRAEPPPEPAGPAPGDLPALLEGLLGPVPVLEDELIRMSGQPSPAVAAALVDLEIGGSVRRHPGGYVSRVVD